MLPEWAIALLLMLLGVTLGWLIMLIAARHIEYVISVGLRLIFGRWIEDEFVIKTLMKCGYLTVLLFNLLAFFGLMAYEILF